MEKRGAFRGWALVTFKNEGGGREGREDREEGARLGERELVFDWAWEWRGRIKGQEEGGGEGGSGGRRQGEGGESKLG
jgi:hypothetical protein